ncbi:MAG: DNA-binding protein [Ruminococcaceae bacterium]|nr:DNA-binding protein [Oscillospiraceae bacterium]
MFEKNLTLGYLLDFYGELLPERKRSVVDMYYNEDLSLGEIAEQIGISRQGVRDIVKKSEEELLFYEEKLKLASKLQAAEKKAEELSELAKLANVPEDIQSKINELSLLISQ